MTDWLSRPRPTGATRWLFPPPDEWPDNDIIGIGADLEPETLISAYRGGIFPMIVETPEPLLAWWSPEARGILPLDGLRVTKSLRQSARHYEVRIDTAFDQVIRGCANPARDRAWITDEFIEAYTTLHELGWAHSIEVFDRQGQLAGGLYGVRVDGLFAGESMFHVQRDASKVALMALVALMKESGMQLLDIQWRTDHLASLGAIEVSRREYLTLLSNALEQSNDQMTK
ncbi:MAG TPA: leucyl/phenylalanyl-tRNA--protein transferase [Planctomycetaceae bacterium]|nr:leucyl/phenylalanyl-tRNA--protein transferase [Planctomycetaceae bacterium]